ncbi:hypothetical protein Lsed01_00659 [Demequina sediminis]|uniref:Uncharacterized protein n=1 Tax=Demequina sediminis TaxID=1930058 RepID=A0ABP9WEH6_9MICO|nr:hypothetical protein [Demequina sediminis]BDZ62021.1 hypothetical protein GCM10025873_18120 [Demequina sediminis]
MGRRHVGRKRHSLDKPWMMRDHAGAPGWAIVLTVVVIALIAAYAFVAPDTASPASLAPTLGGLDPIASGG